jgi:predicted DNA binding CopG/RHH family protein
LDEVTNQSADLILDEHLRDEILSGKRKRKLKNITIKIDPLQVKAIKKLSTMKSIPYQTLIRFWLAEGIKSEMDSVLK